MDKIWAGRFNKQLSGDVNDFNSSISFDSRMFAEDIQGSVAHAKMLARQGIISAADGDAIVAGLFGILADLNSGALEIDKGAEDIHSFIEAELTARIGDAGKRLHTARSRNDQVALDLRMYVKRESAAILDLINELVSVLAQKAGENIDAVMPGYTHLQRAQPVTFAHHLLAYCMMFMRDAERLKGCISRTDSSPLGSCALAGTTYNTDREYAAGLLGFSHVAANSLDAVSDRDFCMECAGVLSIIMVHLSRFAEEVILWCSWEFKFLELDDAYSTGSSIMPQKKNPDIAELVRGKSGRVFGNNLALLTLMKGLPLAYNKDMQEDKEAIFDSLDTTAQCLRAFAPMIATAKVLKDNMRAAADGGFINATDCADYLVKKGMPFRTAYKLTGELVAHCIQNGQTLSGLDFEVYKGKSPLFERDIYAAIDLDACVNGRYSQGGPSPDSVRTQLNMVKKFLEG